MRLCHNTGSSIVSAMVGMSVTAIGAISFAGMMKDSNKAIKGLQAVSERNRAGDSVLNIIASKNGLATVVKTSKLKGKNRDLLLCLENTTLSDCLANKWIGFEVLSRFSGKALSGRAESPVVQKMNGLVCANSKKNECSVSFVSEFMVKCPNDAPICDQAEAFQFRLRMIQDGKEVSANSDVFEYSADELLSEEGASSGQVSTFQNVTKSEAANVTQVYGSNDFAHEMKDPDFDSIGDGRNFKLNCIGSAKCTPRGTTSVKYGISNGDSASIVVFERVYIWDMQCPAGKKVLSCQLQPKVATGTSFFSGKFDIMNKAQKINESTCRFWDWGNNKRRDANGNYRNWLNNPPSSANPLVLSNPEILCGDLK